MQTQIQIFLLWWSLTRCPPYPFQKWDLEEYMIFLVKKGSSYRQKSTETISEERNSCWKISESDAVWQIAKLIFLEKLYRREEDLKKGEVKKQVH